VVLVARPSRATEQRMQLESTIAEQRPQGNPILVAVIILVVIIAIAAIGLYFYL
jgi:hypothetical protein